jgi:hypothetical protein
VNSFPATASLTINGTSFQAGSYEIAVVGTSGSITNSLEVPFSVGDYVIAGTQAISAAPGGQATANLTFASSNFYSGQVNATCDATALSGAQCTLSPANPIAIGSGAVVPVTASINVPSNAIPNTYNISINTQDVTGAPSHDFSISLTVVQDYTIGNFSPASQSVSVGQPASYNFSVLPVGAAYSNVVTLSCAVTPLFVGSCALSPNSVGPLSNSTSAAVVLTVTTQTTNGQLRRPGAKSGPWLYAVWMALPGILWCAGFSRRRRLSAFMGLALVLLFFLPSCGGGGSNGGSSPGGNTQQGTLPGIYTINVIGSPPSVSQPSGSSVTLTVQ